MGCILFSHKNYQILVYLSFYFFFYINFFLVNLIGVKKINLEEVVALLWSLLFISLIFFSNSLLTFSIILEIISLLNYFLFSLDLSELKFNKSLKVKNFTKNELLFNNISSLIFFFWFSLFSSLLLFINLIIYYKTFLTIEIKSMTFLSNSIDKSLSTLLNLSVLIFFFLKSGFSFFFIWKFFFFKNVSFNFLFYYVFIFFLALILIFFYFFKALLILNKSFLELNSILFLIISLILVLPLSVNLKSIKLFFILTSSLNLILIFLSAFFTPFSIFF